MKLVWIILLWIIYLFPTFSFAEDQATITPSMTTNVIHFFHIIISLCSWIWIILASLAGKMLTNTIVYGEFINLDAALFQLWNITRTFANYALGLVILYKILRYIFSDPTQSSPIDITKSIGWVVVGGIGVQFSRFLMGVLIDIATILTVAMGALPTLVITNDGPMQQYLAQQTIKIPKKMVINLDRSLDQPLSDFIFPKDGQTTADGSDMQELGMTEFIDRLIPNAWNAWWPLLYIWLSVIHAQNYLAWTPNMTKNDVTDAIVTIMIKAWLLILYTVALFLLVVINVMRTLYIWLLIAISPFIVLYAGISMMEISVWESFKKFLDRGEALKAIFMPVVFVAYLGLMLVMIVTMQRMMVTNEWYAFNNWSVFVEGDRVWFAGSSFTLEGELWPNAWEDAKSTITDLLLMIFTLLLMYGLVYLATSRWPQFIVDVAAKARTIAMTALGNIPIWWWLTAWSALKLPGQLYDQQMRFTKNLVDKQMTAWEKEVKKFLNDKFGIELGWTLDRVAVSNLERTINWSSNTNSLKQNMNITDFSFLWGTPIGQTKLLETIYKQQYFYDLVNTELKRGNKYKNLYDTNKDKTLSDFVNGINNKSDQKAFLSRFATSLWYTQKAVTTLEQLEKITSF